MSLIVQNSQIIFWKWICLFILKKDKTVWFKGKDIPEILGC